MIRIMEGESDSGPLKKGTLTFILKDVAAIHASTPMILPTQSYIKWQGPHYWHCFSLDSTAP